jgi:hypothetical protein
MLPHQYFTAENTEVSKARILTAKKSAKAAKSQPGRQV